jgi:hypothetical protein
MKFSQQTQVRPLPENLIAVPSATRVLPRRGHAGAALEASYGG